MSPCSKSGACRVGQETPWDVDLTKCKSKIIRSVLVLKGELSPEAVGWRSSWSRFLEELTLPLLSLDFKPWFINRAYLQWHIKLQLEAYDRLMVLVDILVWAAVLFAAPPSTWSQLYVAFGLLSSLAFAIFRAKHATLYSKYRSTFTTIKRLICLPCVKLPYSLAKTVPNSAHWSIVFWHLGFQTGAVYSAGLPLFFFDMWHLSAPLSMVYFIYNADTVVPACAHLLAYQDAAVTKAWQGVAGLLDKTTLGLYKNSMQQSDMAQAACMATANTIQVLAACASLSLLYWVEWGYRLRYKDTLLPAIQRMQQHLSRRVGWLYLAQVVILVLYPAVALTWLVAGAWYGLRPGW